METRALWTIDDALRAFRRGHASPSSLLADCLRRIERLNPDLMAFITIVKPDASPQTMSSQGLLGGIPVALKDLLDTAGIRTTMGSRFFADHVPDHDAFVVAKLRNAGAVLLGKTNTHEIALGVTGNNPHYGTARNPWDRSRIPGGSSSGSAIAVATGMALAALGTDTGGSVRIPASLCGVVGLKPTFGRVSTRGVFPLSWNLDHVGPLTRCVKDAARILQALSGYDPADPASVDAPLGDYLRGLSRGLKGLRIALGVGEHIGTAESGVLSAVREAARVFESVGCTLRDENVDWMRDAAPANRLMTQADGATVHRDRLAEHPEMFGEDVRRRLETGAQTTSTEYVLARRTQTEVRRRCERLFGSFDLLLLPTTPVAAPAIEGHDAVEQAGLLTAFTAPFNLAGVPALSVPCGFTREGLPIGLQLASRAWDEATVLRAGYAYEQRTEWHTRSPAV